MTLNYPTANGTLANHPHAVTSAGSNTYGYDANGNQTTRTIAGQTVTLAYDAENRLVSATGTNLSATFTFDGDGRRVKSVVNGETILFAGGHFEIKGSEVTKYYFAAASRIAVRKYIVPQSSTLTYLAGDHLGSTSLAVDASTGDVIQTRYKPWGEVRYTTQDMTLPTRYTFTGQYSYVSDDATDLGAAGFGLMFYNARWYDPALGRFAQADTIVPRGVQGLDRYAYVNNSPINYIDPSGHDSNSQGGDVILQVDLATYVSLNQYNWRIKGISIGPLPPIGGYGWFACGLVAGADGYAQARDVGRAALKYGYTNAGGIQPKGLVKAYKEVYGEDRVVEHNNWSLDGMFDALQSGSTVIVDFKVGYHKTDDANGVYLPTPTDGTDPVQNFSHFARVLGMDNSLGLIYIECTLPEYVDGKKVMTTSYWTLTYEEFMEVWGYPETSDENEQKDEEDVNHWAVEITTE